MAKFAFHVFLLLIVIAVIPGTPFAKKSIINQIKEMIKDVKYADRVIGCLLSLDTTDFPVCNNYRIQTAEEQLMLAHNYETITRRCLSEKPDKRLKNSCEVYRLLKTEHPENWKDYLSAIKFAINKKKQLEIVAQDVQEGTDIYELLLEHPKVAVAVAGCIIFEESCTGDVKKIKDLVIHAERFGTCEKLTQENIEGCRLHSIFLYHYSILWGEIKAQGRFDEFDSTSKWNLKSTEQSKPEL